MTSSRKKLKSLSAERQQKIAHRTAYLIEEEKSLRELREASGLTQEQIAEVLGVPQGSVSRLENRKDWRLSTLRDYVQAMGGEMHIVVKLPHGSHIQLADLSKKLFENRASAAKRKAKRRSQKAKVTQQ